MAMHSIVVFDIRVRRSDVKMRMVEIRILGVMGLLSKVQMDVGTNVHWAKRFDSRRQPWYDSTTIKKIADGFHWREAASAILGTKPAFPRVSCAISYSAFFGLNQIRYGRTSAAYQC